MAKVFSEGEEARIEQLIEGVVPEEMKKCTAHRLFSDKDNVRNFFESLNDVKLLVKELKEHKDSHKSIKEDMDKIKKYKWINRGSLLRVRVWEGFSQ